MKTKKTSICNPKYANQILEHIQKVSSAGGKSATIVYLPACKHSVNNETRDLFIYLQLLIINVRSSLFNKFHIMLRTWSANHFVTEIR